MCELLDDGSNSIVETKDIWSFVLKEGTKFHPARGHDPYMEGRVHKGDKIGMDIKHGAISFKVNEDHLGEAFEDERLGEELLLPFVKVGEGDIVRVLPGSVV